MDQSLLDAIGAEAAANPMGQGGRIMHKGRILLADGDALAYSTAGNDSTPIGVARHNLTAKVAAAASIAGAERSIILTTAQSSHKGFRYAVARSKPYQGHRTGSHRPKNWAGLREMLETGIVPNVEMTTIAEADDLFGKHATLLGPENVVHYTGDKDMRMLPGWHLDWADHSMHYIPEGTWEVVYNDKVFGRKWFWLQMLMGDKADNIPGLPNLTPANLRSGLVGPATADKMLAGTADEQQARDIVTKAYQSYYPTTWATELLEQGVLLWMRRDQFSSWFDVMDVGNPLAFLNTSEHFEAIVTIKGRIKESLDAAQNN